MERLARDEAVVKAASRDLGVCMVKGLTAGTTVSATMRIASLAGIGVFATGGIGGVHRGDGMDVSADLTELARTDVLVVCAGVKSILDIPRTIEVLETLRVPVAVFGADEFPAFYTARSGVTAGERFDDVGEIAAVWAANRALGLGTGMLVANPIPAADALDAGEIGATIDAALAAAIGAGGDRQGRDAVPARAAERGDGRAGAGGEHRARARTTRGWRGGSRWRRRARRRVRGTGFRGPPGRCRTVRGHARHVVGRGEGLASSPMPLATRNVGRPSRAARAIRRRRIASATPVPRACVAVTMHLASA